MTLKKECDFVFNSDNRWFHLYIPFDAETVLMAVLWLCLLIVVFHFFRKRTKLIQNFGVTTLLLLLGLVLVRLFMPIQLNYSKDIPSVLLGRISSFFCDTQLFVLPGLSVGVTPLHLVLAVWLAGIVISLVQFLWYTRKCLKAYLETTRDPLPEETELLEQVQKEFHGGRPARMYHAMVLSPMTYGYFRPTILLPMSQLYTRDELRCVLLHELTHRYHRDSWIKLLVQILCCLFWWNPLMYLFRQDVNQTLELHCDASVCARLTPSEQCDYLQAIVGTMSFSHSVQKRVKEKATTASRLSSQTQQEMIAQRMELLVKINERSKHTKWYYVVTVFVMMAALLCTYLFAFSSQSQEFNRLEYYTSGVAVNQENSYLVEYPEGCYFLAVKGQPDSPYALQTLTPLENSALVEQALHERGLEVKTVDKEGFLEVLALSGSQDPESDYLFWAYMYFPDLLTPEEREAFSIEEYGGDHTAL